MLTLQVKKLYKEATLPSRAYAGDLGYDLYLAEPIVTIHSGDQQALSTGISIVFPPGYGGLISDRSSIALTGIFIIGGVIDNEYRGEIKVIMYNGTATSRQFQCGDKIAQMILVPVVNIPVVQLKSDVTETSRGNKGFGSTGK